MYLNSSQLLIIIHIAIIFIAGTGFDENPGQTKVLIGGNECEIQDIDSVSLTCLTPSEETSDATLWPGNAGLKYQLWLDAEIEISLNMTLDILSGVLIYIELFGPLGQISELVICTISRAFVLHVDILFATQYLR